MAKKRDRKVWRLEELEAKIHREFCPDAIKLATRLAERTGLLVKQLAEMPVEDILNFKQPTPVPQFAGVDRRPKVEKWTCIESCLRNHHKIDGYVEAIPRQVLVERTKIPYATIFRLFKESPFGSWKDYEKTCRQERPVVTKSELLQHGHFQERPRRSRP